MRIGDRDTDTVYDRLIAPIIRRVGLMIHSNSRSVGL